MKLVITNAIGLILLLSISNSEIYGQTWTLQQCIDSAYLNNTKIAIAKNNIILSNLGYKEIKSNLLPKVNVTGEYKYFVELPYQILPLSVFGGPEGKFREAQFGVPHNLSANVVIQAPIYSASLMGNINKFESNQKIVEIEVQKTYEQVYYEVTNIYRNAQLIKSQLIFIDSTIANTKEITKNVISLSREKLATKNDVKKLDLKVSTLQSYYANLELKLNQLYNALKLLTNSKSAIEVEDNILMIDIKSYKENGNKDLDIIGLQKELVNIDLKSLKHSKYIPEIGFIALYGMQGFGYDQTPNSFLNFYPIGYVGLRFSYPLFNGTITNKKIEQRNIELDNIKLKEKLTLDAQKTEIENEILKLENVFKLVELSKLQVELSQSIYLQEANKQKEGIISINDLLIAQNDLIQNKQNYLITIAEFLATDLQLKKLTNNIVNN